MELRPLTLLAGANSSGKSSMMQLPLLMKQTLECSYDPGPLLLNGPNVGFTSAEQMFFRGVHLETAKRFGIEFASSGYRHLYFNFSPAELNTFQVKIGYSTGDAGVQELREGMPESESKYFTMIGNDVRKVHKDAKIKIKIKRERFLLQPSVSNSHSIDGFTPVEWAIYAPLVEFVRGLIHLPGLRGNPLRAYPTAAVSSTFPGPFETYTASLIHHWQTSAEKSKLNGLAEDLVALGLTSIVKANRLNDAQIELLVGRMPVASKQRKADLVNIADVGVGVSQTLPVLVALHAAAPGQTVYLEQPEIHLHPRAQVAMAAVLARAVIRGVRLVVETHSALLLLAIQTLVAEQKSLAPSDVKLHWFQRSPKDGSTTIASADLDESGAFGDWPEDFGDVELKAEGNYLTAAEAKLYAKSRR
jgi:hypothetical protein